MEQHRFPRRSASHGTLRSSYSSHGGPGAGPSVYRPLHKPLRSVNENSVLLHSPGALESMLKTTTETGDIGIFTIRPIPPSPLVPRDTLSDVGRPRPRPRPSVDNLSRHNVAGRPSSHRDAMSEVFSLYGSDSLKSGTSTHSPNSTDDQGQRSYSMTTCGSRHLSHHRSTNTLQSQASGGSQLQRPRSPFPYPTRLKRPGVRPASPAITENGRVDYSRMVEINRVSYRTVHGPFKHTYAPIPRRPHPLGLRLDVNRSTPSLAPPGPPPTFHGPHRPPPVRTHSPASMVSWNPSFHEGYGIVSERASSLTSVTNVYRHMPPGLRTSQTCPADPPPRYYDYTEDFENKPPRLSSLTQGLTPMPPRAIRYPQSSMLRHDEDHLSTGHLAAVFGEGDSAFFDCESQIVEEQGMLPILTAIPKPNEGRTATPGKSAPNPRPDSAPSHISTIEFEGSGNAGGNTRGSDIDLLPSQMRRESIETFNPCLDLEYKDPPSSYNYVTYHAHTAHKTKTKSPERYVQVLGGRALTIRSEQGVILRDDTNYEATSRQTPETSRSDPETGVNESHLPNQPCEAPIDQAFQRQELHGIRAASFQAEPHRCPPSVSYVERLSGNTSVDSPKQINPSFVRTATELNRRAEKEAEQKPQDNKPGTNSSQQLRRHKRNHAALEIITTNLPREDNEGHPHITPTCSTAPLVSPKPISPARQLKVKNSIPQLMKALPPLPGVLGYDLAPTTTEMPEEDEFAEILVPFSFHSPNKPLEFNQPHAVSLDPVMGSVAHANNGPKFRLKIKTSSCSEASHDDENAPHWGHLPDIETTDELEGKQMRSGNWNKLKVRSPRRSRLSSSHASTIRHNPGVETSRIVTDLMRRKPQDLFSISLKPETMLLRKRRQSLSQLAYPQAVTVFNGLDPAPSPLTEGVDSVSYQALSNISADPNEVPDFECDTNVSSTPPHHLMKRLSNLRALFTSSTPAASPVQATGITRMDEVTADASTNTDLGIKNHLEMRGSPCTERTSRRLSRCIRARLLRFVQGARNAMRRCARRKHNRREQAGTEPK
ncbi:hypothetical protein F4802DRAFT_607652 [Xylaria palmicola]|nr:hypothetical protein F4802DRAFT_607652 [Xylaria palmicola]